MNLQQKLEKLKIILLDLKSVAVAYSGGVDSTFLLKIAKDVLGEKIVAVTCRAAVNPESEFEEARIYAEKINVKYIVFDVDVFKIEEFKNNLKDRCYYCKHRIFSNIKEIAKKSGVEYVVDGSIVDDEGDFRPGMNALKELFVKSPLKEAGFTKNDIRQISKEMDIPTWNKQSYACLASRIPYGNEITLEKLKMIQKAEELLMNMGFKQLRVRHHGNIARIEVASEERVKFFNTEIMDKIGIEFKKLGFTYTALELLGYRTGSMNEVLSEKEKL